MKEFGTFSKKTQRYIRRSLDIGLNRRSDVEAIWGRSGEELKAIRAQTHNYRLRLSRIREHIPASTHLAGMEPFLGPLVPLTAFDLGNGSLPDFASFRFLYERLFGARIRPWLPTAYVTGASTPYLAAALRIKLLQAISEAACSADAWSLVEPVFFPEWVDKVEGAPPALPPA